MGSQSGFRFASSGPDGGVVTTTDGHSLKGKSLLATPQIMIENVNGPTTARAPRRRMSMAMARVLSPP